MSAQSIHSSSTATLLAHLRTRRLEQRRDFHLVLLTGIELEHRGQLNGGSDDRAAPFTALLLAWCAI